MDYEMQVWPTLVHIKEASHICDNKNLLSFVAGVSLLKAEL